MNTDKERGRILGVKQAAAFVRNLHDEPTIADEIIQYVIPHGYKVKSTINKKLLKERYGS